LAVNAGALAIPLEFVATLAVNAPLKLPLAPLPGVVNVTVCPVTGLPPESVTLACSTVAKTVLMVALCGVPPLAFTLAAAPALLVRLKLAAVATPATLAVTV